MSADDTHAKDARPFIIWTLRRTGGTNLAQHLFGLSPLPGVEHEPFNIGRMYGHITEKFRHEGNNAALIAAMETICGERRLIKHCVETVPMEVSLALLDRAMAHGYRHLFLIRRSPGDRLLSLHFAQTSGVWGAVHLKDRPSGEIAEEVRETPIPIARLRDREISDRAALRTIYDRLDAAGERPLIAMFEDLYNYTDRPVSMAILARLKDALELEVHDGAEAADHKVLFGGAQKTREIYALYPNYAAFQEAMGRIGPLEFRPPPPLDAPGIAAFTASPGCQLFALRQSWRSDLVRLDGTALPPAGWEIRADGTALPMQDGLRSANLAGRMPDTPEAATARFAVLDLPLDALERIDIVPLGA